MLANANPGLLSQYVLDITLTDTTPPLISSLNLPAEGSVSTAVVDRFTIGFSEDMSAGTVNATTNHDLRAAGLDGSFGTADDEVYALIVSPAYSRGFSASYRVSNGPLQPGVYRFTAGTALADPAGNHLAAPYVRNFTVAGVSLPRRRAI